MRKRALRQVLVLHGDLYDTSSDLRFGDYTRLSRHALRRAHTRVALACHCLPYRPVLKSGARVSLLLISKLGFRHGQLAPNANVMVKRTAEDLSCS